MQTPAFAATKTARTSKLFRGLIWVAAVMAACLCPKLAFGQTNSSWNGGTGSWSNATDWTPNQVPNNGGGNTYNVTIDSGGVDTVTLDQSASINSLVLGGLVQPTLLQDLAGSPDTLSISGQLRVSQAATLQFSNGSSVTVGGNLSNDGSISFSNGSTLTVTGTLGNYNAIQSLQLYGAGTVLNAGSLVNDGVIIIGNGATLNLTNQPQGITEISGEYMGVFGTVKAGSANGFANLGELDLEAYFVLGNGQTTTTTPGSGTLGIGFLALLGMTNSASGAGTTLIVKGNLFNSGMLETDFSSTDTKRNTLTVTGTFTNTNDSTAVIGSLDVMNVGSLANNGSLAIGGTLNLTGQPDGVTDVPAGSDLAVGGTLKAGSRDGLAELGSIEGSLGISNGQTTTITPGTGTLTIASTGGLGVGVSNVAIVGNLENSGGQVDVGQSNVTVTGTFSNIGGADTTLDNGSVLTVGTLINDYGFVDIKGGSTLVIDKSGTLTNTGLLNVGIQSGSGGTLEIGGNVTLNGGGRLNLGYGSQSVIEGASSNDVLTNVNNLIIGAGNIGNGTMGFVNGPQGKIETSGNNRGNDIKIDVSSAGFNNQGLIQVNYGDTVSITGPVGSFVNFNSSTNTLTGGSYELFGTLEFDGANIVTNDANITLASAQAEIIDQNGNNGLAGFAANGSNGTFRLNPGANFTTAGNFTNDGTLYISLGSKFAVGTNGADDLTNFSGTTLTGGTYVVGGTLQFNGANIVTNEANITLNAAKAIIEDENGNNALANFAVNGSNGSFTLKGAQKFSTSGTFKNAGNVTISSGTTFTVGGMKGYNQTAGTTSVNGGLIVGTPGAVNVSGGSLFGLGTITGNVNLTRGTLSPGTAANNVGELTIDGKYKQGAAGVLDIDLAGTYPAVQYDVLNISGAAILDGTLDVDALSSFTPMVGETFDILDYGSETGTFSSVDCNFSNGDTCSIAYNSTGAVLTIDAPLAAANGSARGTAVKAVSRAFTVASSTTAREPVAISSRATCFAGRLSGTALCDRASVTAPLHEPEVHAGTGVSIGEVHNNIMVATRSISSEPGGISRETSVSATAMARFYLCAYLPSGVAHTMACN